VIKITTQLENKAEMLEISNSSALRLVGYCEKCHLLKIRFQPNYNNGNLYDYPNVPVNIYKGLITAISKGTFFNQYIRKQFSNPRELVRLARRGKECRHF